jgi:ribosomal protein S12 methylthiotransferase
MLTKSTTKKKVNIVTLGCSKNTVDSEVLMGQLSHGGIEVVHESTKEDFDVVIVNTCGFIDKAKEESINTILQFAEAKNKGWIEKLYVTGCLSQRYKENLEEEIKEVDGFFGTMELPLLLNRFEVDYKKELIGERVLSMDTHYAYLKISEGCNRKCTFCAIPLMRGLHKSRTIESLVDETKNLAKKGVKEIILIAQELTYYGLDIYKRKALVELIQELSKVEGIEWIRLHYAYPAQFPYEILDEIRDNPKVCKYLDIPIQHVSDKVLSDMKRNTTKQYTIDLIKRIRETVPGIAIRTTLLTGFPTETEEDFEQLVEFIQEMRFERMGVFTYSHEENTGAYKYDDEISEEEKIRRQQTLMEVQSDISYDINQSRVGEIYRVLIDKFENGNFIGRSQYDSPEVDNEVIIQSEDHIRIGDFVDVRIIEATEFDLIGELVKS